MEEKLIEIAKMMNSFSKEYDYQIEVEAFESKNFVTGENRIIYNLKAVEPQKTIVEIVS